MEEEGGTCVKSFHKGSILGEADFLGEALIAWSSKRKRLRREVLVTVRTTRWTLPNNCILHRVSSPGAGLPPACVKDEKFLLTEKTIVKS